MKRALALTAIALAIGTALGGCRGDVPQARRPEPPAAVQTSARPSVPAPWRPESGQPADVSAGLSDVDRMLREMDDQLTKADATPVDGD